MMNEKIVKAKILTGKVVSNKMDKTIVVEVTRREQHPIYKKIIKRTSKIHAHDEKNSVNNGDTVRIAEHRPISKTKAWKLVDVVEKAE